MYKRIRTAHEKYERVLQRHEDTLAHYKLALEKSFSDVTSRVFQSQNPSLMKTYSELAGYLLETSEDPKKLSSALEKLVRTAHGKVPMEPKEVQYKGKSRPRYITMKQAVDILKQEEIKNGIPEEEMASYAAYSQRIRYQIKQGKLTAKKKNKRISKFGIRQFEKLIPKMTYSPAAE
ncbi:Uncharacterised protein [uncultured archaeon]|nr:Uncharacterised protein [uncultured archaeon]